MTKSLFAIALAVVVSVTQAHVSTRSPARRHAGDGASHEEAAASIRSWLDDVTGPVDVHAAGLVSAPPGAEDISVRQPWTLDLGDDAGCDPIRTVADDSLLMTLQETFLGPPGVPAQDTEFTLLGDGPGPGSRAHGFPGSSPRVLPPLEAGSDALGAGDFAGGISGGGGGGTRVVSDAGPAVIVPAPASVALVLAALAVAGLRRRRIA